MYKFIMSLLAILIAACDGGINQFSNSKEGQSPATIVTHTSYHPLPGTIDAVDYVRQSGTLIGSIEGGSEYVGSIHSGDYTEYAINVPQAGSYLLEAQVAGVRSGSINFSVDGREVAAELDVSPTGDWHVWQAVSTTAQLAAGEQALRLQYAGDSSQALMNITRLSLQPVDNQRQTTISSLAEFIDLQGASNQNIKMLAGTYPITSDSKSLFSGGDWRGSVEQSWPGLFDFTGSNNTFDLTGVKFTFESTIFEEMPFIAHGLLVRLGGAGNVWNGFSLEEVPDGDGNYGTYRHTSGGSVLEITGADHQINNLTLRSRFSLPYGLGSLYGKTGSSTGTLPGSRLTKKSGLLLRDLQNTRFENTLIDHSSFGHGLFMSGPIDHVVFDTITVIAESRSTDDLISEGITGTDRNGVPFAVNYQGVDLIGSSGNSGFIDLFDVNNLNRCQNLDSNSQNAPIEPGYQYSLIEGVFRGYQQEEIGAVEIYNAHVIGARTGLALEYASGGVIIDNMKVTGVAGHGVPACGGWNGSNGGEGDASAFGPSSNSILRNVQADAAYATIIETSGDRTNITADIEVLDPEDGYNRPAASTALALVSGSNHKIRLWKRDNQSLDEDLIVKVGNDETSNLLLCNMTRQAVSLSEKVDNSIIYSVGLVQDSSGATANNQIVRLADAADEPEVCEMLKSEFLDLTQSPNTSSELQWGDKVVLAEGVDDSYTDCGWYGCQVGYMTDTATLDFAPGGDDPTGFYLRHPAGSSSDESCISWNDKVVIAYSSNPANTSNCGLYGCRVARLNDTGRGIEFGHGLTDPATFHVRPPVDEPKSGCVMSADEVVLAVTSANSNTSNCGWYGCRVLRYDGSAFSVGHGLDNPQGVHLHLWNHVTGD